MNIFFILIIPFLGTLLGSAVVFFMKNDLNKKLRKLLLGFASGVMVAASVWSLIIPAISQSHGMGRFAFFSCGGWNFYGNGFSLFA